MRRRELSIWRVLLTYALVLAAGAQGGLYLMDTLGDGVSDPLSGFIALLFLSGGLGFVVWAPPDPTRLPADAPPSSSEIVR
jgi:hypothetical protein